MGKTIKCEMLSTKTFVSLTAQRPELVDALGQQDWGDGAPTLAAYPQKPS